MKKRVIIVIGIVCVGLIGMVGFAVFKRQSPEPVGCTMEAKLCPDGSAVGRSGPECTFAPCPSVPIANENIRVTLPLPDDVVKSPLKIQGEARGLWYFEGSFPVSIIGENGMTLGQGIAQAQGDWMTTDWVPFEATISFTVPETATGTLILEKDNSSGLPENADELRVPVRFAP
ncbi:MAG: Gmad2 immunoglobulin-like domain-containing protein [Candidatus Moraniibacteriota bacterium]